MKAYRYLALLAIGLACISPTAAEITPDELISAVDNMSPEQAYLLQDKLDAKLWKPIPEGFFSRLAVLVSVSGSAFDDINLSSLSLSAPGLDIEAASGGELELLWRCFSPRFRIGVKLASLYARDSDLEAEGYSRADFAASGAALVMNLQLVRGEYGLLWAELAAGSLSAAMETVDTPAGQPTTLRELNGDCGILDISAGAALRLNPVLSLLAGAGYCFAEDIELQEGGEETNIELDISGFNGRVGIAFNF